MKEKKMSGFIIMLEKYITPIAEKIEGQRHISSIKNGMISLMAILMVGSISLIVMGLGNFFPDGSSIKNLFDNYNAVLGLPFMFTYGLLSIYAAVTISYAHSQKMEVPILHSILGAVLATAILNVKAVDGTFDFSFMDSRGLFIAIFASLVSVEIMSFLIKKKVTIRIKGLPDMIGKTFEAIIPLLIIICISVFISIFTQAMSGGKILPEVFVTVLGPATRGIDTPLAVFLVALFEMIFWFLGLNGYAILVSFTLPFMTQYLTENAQAFASGGVPTHIFTENFWGYFMACTGSGVTGAISILGLMSKSKELKAAGKASIIPAIFNISEPVVYGFPVAYNPYLFIPFVIGTPILSVFSFYVFKLGFINKPVVNVGGMPSPIAQYLITLDWKAPIYAVIIVFLGIIMYYPFFKMYEKSVLAEEEKVAEVDKELEELDLDF